jgi:hypothetical protein
MQITFRYSCTEIFTNSILKNVWVVPKTVSKTAINPARLGNEPYNFMKHLMDDDKRRLKPAATIM